MAGIGCAVTLAVSPCSLDPKRLRVMVAFLRLPEALGPPRGRRQGQEGELLSSSRVSSRWPHCLEQLLRTTPGFHVDEIAREGDWKTPLFVAAEHGHTQVRRHAFAMKLICS